MRYWFWILLCSIISAEDFRVRVGVSLAPYAYFVQRIGGDFVKVDILIPQQKNPRNYDLNYEQVRIVKDLRLLIGAGTPYEKKWFDRFKNTNPSLWLLQTQDEDCIEDICYAWLSPENVIKIAKEIAYVLRIIDLKNAKNYKRNLDLFLDEIAMLSDDLKRKIAGKNSEIFAYQSGWKNFTQEFGLSLVLWRNKKQNKSPYLVTPFDPTKQMMRRFSLPKKSFIEINPFAYDWKDTILKLGDFVAGMENGE